MMSWLLLETEKDPSRIFMEKELIARSRKDYDRVKKDGLLKFVRLEVGSDYVPCPVRCALPCSGMKLYPPPPKREGFAALACCDEDPDVDPLLLIRKDLAAHRLDLGALAGKFREANSLDGKPSRLDHRLLYLGEAHSGGFTLAVVLGFFPDARAAVKALLALPNLLSVRSDRCLVVLPSLEIADQADLVLLERFGIFPVILDGEDPFKIDLSPALKKAVEKPVAITLTPEEEKEFDRHQFKSRLPIRITGDVEKREKNIVYIGTSKVALENSLFKLFLRLVVELFKGGDGSVHKGDPETCGGLVDEDILKPDYIDHTINKLREKLGPALQGLPSTDFIEAFRQKHIRLSTHPRYITFDKNKLLNHPDSKIAELAIKLNP